MVMRMPKGRNQNPEHRQATLENTIRVLGSVASIKHTLQHQVLYLVAAVILGNITTVLASSAGHTGEAKEKPGLSLKAEIADMQKLLKKQGTDETEGQYMLYLLSKSNPELDDTATNPRVLPVHIQSKGVC